MHKILQNIARTDALTARRNNDTCGINLTRYVAASADYYYVAVWADNAPADAIPDMEVYSDRLTAMQCTAMPSDF